MVEHVSMFGSVAEQESLRTNSMIASKARCNRQESPPLWRTSPRWSVLSTLCRCQLQCPSMSTMCAMYSVRRAYLYRLRVR